MKKLHAFTLMELLIGMIISSIVIGFGYATYALIYKQYQNYKNVKGTLMETSQLYSTLSEDIHRAQLISFSGNTLSIRQNDHTDLNYAFYDKQIIRTDHEMTDTFKIVATDLKTQFLFPDNPSFLQQFSFELNVAGEKEYFNFTKDYSSETLMKYKPVTQPNP